MTDPDSERDAGFCSGADEDDLSGLHSPSASEDSVEVNVTTISSLRNKRKLVEPRKFEETDARPLKKRRRYETEASICDEETRSEGASPFRPWSDVSPSKRTRPVSVKADELAEKADDSETSALIPSTTELEEAQNLSLNIKKEEEAHSRLREDVPKSVFKSREVVQRREQRRHLEPVPYRPVSYESANQVWLQEEPLSLVLRGSYPPRVPSHPAVSNDFERPAVPFSLSSSMSSVSSSSSCSVAIPLTNHPRTIHVSPSIPVTKTPSKTATNSQQSRHHQAGQQRNYKNMTRERRIEANARERTRVHTISAAFDTLRRAIPAYSHNQKLSKLSVLRIACSYIMTLGKIMDKGVEEEQNCKDSLESCVDMVSKTIQTEGKLRKKKED